MKIIVKLFGCGVLVLSMIYINGCSSIQGKENTVGWTTGGTLAGAGVGMYAGKMMGNHSAANMLIGGALGAGAGALGGYLFGQKQDKTDNQIEQLQLQQSLVTINIQNSNGSFTPVTLQHIGNGQYRGPRGEIYNGIPSQSQLSGYAY